MSVAELEARADELANLIDELRDLTVKLVENHAPAYHAQRLIGCANDRGFAAVKAVSGIGSVIDEVRSLSRHLVAEEAS